MDEKEMLRVRAARDKERFSRDFSAVEARLKQAKAAIEAKRSMVEAALLERDVKIEKLEKHVEMQTRLIESYRKQSTNMYSTLLDADPLKKLRRSCNQDDEDTCSTNSRSSSENDQRVYALEQQVSRLFGQLQEERGAVDALEQQIELQKAANVKLLKTVKSLKRKLQQESEDNSMEHMLHDLQTRYRKVCLEQECNTSALEAANTKIARCLMEKEELEARIYRLSKQHEDDLSVIAARNNEIQELLKKIGKQERYIADLEADYKTLGTIVPGNTQSTETQHLQGQLARKNEELAALELQNKQLLRDLEVARSTCSDDNTHRHLAFGLTDLDQIHTQALRVEHKTQVIASMVDSYEDGGDLHGLLLQLDDPVETPILTSIQEGKQQVLMSLLESQSTLDNMSDRFASTYARSLGAQCAMQ